MTKSGLSTAQLHVLRTMWVYDCAAMFLTYATQGHYRNRSGVVSETPTPNRKVLIALERRGLVWCCPIARREVFELTDKGYIFMTQREGGDVEGKLLTKREIQAILLAHYAAFILGKRVEGFRIEIWQKKPHTDARVCVLWLSLIHI